MGVRELFVHAGTIRLKDRRLTLTLPQTWSVGADSLPVHLVFNFDYGVVRAFPTLKASSFAAQFWDIALWELGRARAARVRVSGIQLDFDCPTRRLPKYAEALRIVRRQAAREKLSLSITALATWLPSPEVRQLTGAVDFLVPQFYEAETVATRSGFRPIFSPDRLRRGLAAAGRLGSPFYAGLPAYGHALVFDNHDRLIGMFHDAAPDAIYADPRFRFETSFMTDSRGGPATRESATGEDIVDFAAPAPDGSRTWHLRYDLPTPGLISRAMAQLRQDRPRSCRGVILFRFPEPSERTTLPFSSLESALGGRPAAPDIRVQIKSSSSPWEIIETGSRAARPPQEVMVTVENRGNAATFFASDSVTLTILFDRPGFELPPTFAGAETLRIDGPFDAPAATTLNGMPAAMALNDALAASPARANVLRIRRPIIGPGERIVLGPIRIPADGATRARAFWTARGFDGFDQLTGELPVANLAPGQHP
jgi:hypothetical protein